MHTTTFLLGLLAVYVVHRQLPDSCWPAHVVRHEGITLLMVDPRCSKMDVHAYCTDHLTVDEINVLREAWSEPPVGQPMSEWMMEGSADVWIPPSLRLPTVSQAQATA